jgi:polysaccharide export outer membrane protein
LAPLLLVLASLTSLASCASPGQFVWYHDLPKAEWGGRSNEYVIVPGDGISIKVYEQDALSAAGKVRSDGRLALPLVGEIVAAGKQPSMLARELEGRFREFVVSPRVTVNVDSAMPVSIIMVGEIAKIGTVTLEPPATLLQAVATAGGPNEYADRSRIFVLRRSPEFKRIRFTYDALIHNESGAALFSLHAGDVVVVE